MSHGQRSSMLDFVRRTCDAAQSMPDFEGVYEPDPEQVAAWQANEAEEHDGELRCVNIGPQEVRKRLESGTDPVEKEALKTAFQYWQNAGAYAVEGWTEAGSVYRGEPRETREASSMRELAAGAKIEPHVTAVGTLAIGGVSSVESKPVDGSSYVDRGVIDWNMLLNMGPLPETEDWF